MSSITPALSRLLSSRSLKYLPLCRPSIQRVYIAFQGNRDLCYTFLQHCVDYGKKVIDCHPSSIILPTSLPVLASHDLRGRAMRLSSEMTDRSVGNAASVQGLSSYRSSTSMVITNTTGHYRSLDSRRFKAAYKKALSLEQKMTSGFNTLLGMLISWVSVIDSHGLPDEVTLKQRRKLWQKARDSIRTGLATLNHEPVPRMSYDSAPLASTPPRSVMRRWTVNRRNANGFSFFSFGWILGWRY